jgi:HK97 gp10 family phage protein
MLKVNQAELAAILERLKETAEKVGKKGVRQAARKAMVPVRDQVKANAPEDMSHPDDIMVKANVSLVTKWRGNNFYARIGIKGGAKKNPDTPFYWRFHEFGTKHLPARPFMAPALESNAQQILDTITAELRKALFK